MLEQVHLDMGMVDYIQSFHLAKMISGQVHQFQNIGMEVNGPFLVQQQVILVVLGLKTTSMANFDSLASI